MRQAVGNFSVWVAGKPISVNAMYGTGRRGQHYLTREAEGWREQVWADVTAATRTIAVPPPLHVVCTFYGVRGDADNYLKATLDGLKLALRVDDRHFQHVEAHVVRSRKQGVGAHIEVSLIPTPRRTAMPAVVAATVA